MSVQQPVQQTARSGGRGLTAVPTTENPYPLSGQSLGVTFGCHSKWLCGELAFPARVTMDGVRDEIKKAAEAMPAGEVTPQPPASG